MGTCAIDCFDNQFTAHVLGIGDSSLNIEADNQAGCRTGCILCRIHDWVLEHESQYDVVLLLLVVGQDCLAFV